MTDHSNNGGPAYPGAFKSLVSIALPSGRGVAERWRSQYQNKADGKWTSTVSGPSDAIYAKLCALGPAPDPNAVAEIIGNKGWTHPTCKITHDYLDVGVTFSLEYDEDITLSPDLVFEAARLLAERVKHADATP